MIQRLYDFLGVVAAEPNADFGDMCNRTFAYHTLNVINAVDIEAANKSYHLAVSNLEVEPGVYLRGISDGQKDNWWFTTKNCSRDQLAMVLCAQIAWGDMFGSRRFLKAWAKRGFFAQNVYKNYVKAEGKKTIPDIITVSMIANFIRGCSFDWLKFLLPVLDLGLFVDLWLARYNYYDYYVQLVPTIIAANLRDDTWASRYALEQLYRNRYEIHKELVVYFASPWANCLPEMPDFYIKAIERLHESMMYGVKV